MKSINNPERVTSACSTPAEHRANWQPPKLYFMGKLGDLVQGGPGKTTGEFDQDSGGFRFPPGQEDK